MMRKANKDMCTMVRSKIAGSYSLGSQEASLRMWYLRYLKNEDGKTDKAHGKKKTLRPKEHKNGSVIEARGEGMILEV